MPNYKNTIITLSIMLGSVILGHLTLWIFTTCYKKNNKVILPYDEELDRLEGDMLKLNSK